MNRMKLLSLVALCAFGLSLGLAACGEDETDFIGECCLNGQFFSCDSQAEMDTCTLADGASDCTREPSRDDECLTE